MTYTPYSPDVFPIFIYYIILIVLSVIVTIMMFRKYIERKTKATLYMSLAYLASTIALIMVTIGLAEAIITLFFKEIYRFTFPFGYALLTGAGMFLLFCAREVTESSKFKYSSIVLILIGFIVIILLFLPTNWWGVPQKDYQDELNTRLVVTIILVLYNLIIYGVMARMYYRAKRKTSDPVASFGFKLLFYSMICPMIFLLFVIIDTAFIIFANHPGYTIFMYIAWFFLMAFFLLSYLALIMPKWVKKRIN